MRKHLNERGQALIWAAIVFVVLLAAVALAVDFGSVWSWRRTMQNAADAAALEAARAYCFDGATTSAAAALGEAYAIGKNRAEQADVVSSVTANNNPRFTATASIDAPTYLAGVFGVDTITVPASASAICGPASGGTGLLPIAFSLPKWKSIADSCGAKFWVWSSDKDADKAPDCGECDCDTDNDGVDDVFTSAGRAWLDFSGVMDTSDTVNFPVMCGSNGCGANELKCWMEKQQPSRIVLPKCIASDTGNKSGVHNQVDERAALPGAGSLGRIPLYTGTCDSSSHCGQGDGYYVTQFGCAKMGGWEQSLELPYQNKTNKNTCWKGKAIWMFVSCDPWCDSSTGTGKDTPPVTGGVNAVGLVQ